MSLLVAIEHSGFSLWMREDPYAYFIALIIHALGMALLVGGAIVVCLRVLGAASRARLDAFRGFFRVMWLGAWLAIGSGVGLLWAYPAKALTNPVFAVKFACLIGAAILMGRLARGTLTVPAGTDVAPPGSRPTAAVALLLWLGGVAAGKLLLHTYSVLTVG